MKDDVTHINSSAWRQIWHIQPHCQTMSTDFYKTVWSYYWGALGFGVSLHCLQCYRPPPHRSTLFTFSLCHHFFTLPAKWKSDGKVKKWKDVDNYNWKPLLHIVLQCEKEEVEDGAHLTNNKLSIIVSVIDREFW